MRFVYTFPIWLILFFSVVVFEVSSQELNGQWSVNTQPYNEQMTVDSLGNSYFSYVSHSGQDHIPAYSLAKYDTDGNLLWTVTSSPIDHYNIVALSTDTDGNIYLAGILKNQRMTFGTAVLDNTTEGGQDIFLIKFDPDGNVILSLLTGHSNTVTIAAFNIDSNSNIYIAGEYGTDVVFGSMTYTNPDVGSFYIVKLSTSGQVLWSKIVNKTYTQYEINYFSLQYGGPTSINGIVLIGWYHDDLKFETGVYTKDDFGYGSFIVQYDELGTEQWSTVISLDGYTGITKITNGRNNELYVAGNCGLENQSSISFFYSKYSNLGQQEWIRRSTSETNVELKALCEDNAGNSYLAGYFQGSSLTIGNTTLNSSESMYRLQVFAAKIDPNGNTLGLGTATATGILVVTMASGIDCDKDGHVYLMGYSECDSISFGEVKWYKTGYDANEGFLTKLSIDSSLVTNSLSTNHKTIITSPNPTQGSFNISGLNEGKWSIRVMTLAGNCIYEQLFNGTGTQVNLSEQAKGFYLVELFQDKDFFGIERILVE